MLAEYPGIPGAPAGRQAGSIALLRGLPAAGACQRLYSGVALDVVPSCPPKPGPLLGLCDPPTDVPADGLSLSLLFVKNVARDSVRMVCRQTFPLAVTPEIPAVKHVARSQDRMVCRRAIPLAVTPEIPTGQIRSSLFRLCDPPADVPADGCV